MRIVWLATIAAAMALGGSPSYALTSFGSGFASFSTLPGGTFYWLNDGDPSVGGNGQGGALFTTTTPLTPAPNAILISFTWASAGLNAINATLVFRGTVTNTIATGQFPSAGAQIQQSGVNNGSFSIFGLGQTLLTGVYNNGTIQSIFGASYAYLTVDSYPPRMLGFSSTFATLPPGPYSLVLTKTGIPAPGTAFVPGKAFTSFDPQASGIFYAFVPEPGSWTMLIAGFGLVGAALRRRRAVQPAAAAA